MNLDTWMSIQLFREVFWERQRSSLKLLFFRHVMKVIISTKQGNIFFPPSIFLLILMLSLFPFAMIGNVTVKRNKFNFSSMKSLRLAMSEFEGDPQRICPICLNEIDNEAYTDTCKRKKLETVLKISLIFFSLSEYNRLLLSELHTKVG